MIIANLMCELDPVNLSTKERATSGQWVGEVVAKFGLLVFIFGVVRSGRAAPGAPGETGGWLSRPHPGFAYRRYGPRDVITFLGGHLTFGVLLGVLYPALGVAAAG